MDGRTVDGRTDRITCATTLNATSWGWPQDKLERRSLENIPRQQPFSCHRFMRMNGNT